eukprot:COSAG01_NODE_16375_length_1241_cov_1.666375_1_plen_223_part_01
MMPGCYTQVPREQRPPGVHSSNGSGTDEDRHSSSDSDGEDGDHGAAAHAGRRLCLGSCAPGITSSQRTAGSGIRPQAADRCDRSRTNQPRRRDAFLSLNLTLQDVDTVSQSYKCHGYLNMLLELSPEDVQALRSRDGRPGDGIETCPFTVKPKKEHPRTLQSLAEVIHTQGLSLETDEAWWDAPAGDDRKAIQNFLAAEDVMGSAGRWLPVHADAVFAWHGNL